MCQKNQIISFLVFKNKIMVYRQNNEGGKKVMEQFKNPGEFSKDEVWPVDLSHLLVNAVQCYSGTV